jgi:hypothetical protein
VLDDERSTRRDLVAERRRVAHASALPARTQPRAAKVEDRARRLQPSVEILLHRVALTAARHEADGGKEDG